MGKEMVIKEFLERFRIRFTQIFDQKMKLLKLR